MWDVAALKNARNNSLMESTAILWNIKVLKIWTGSFLLRSVIRNLFDKNCIREE